ncbi:MAG TPA: UDP-N-acetylmuramoyl-tripeptide--D-alanyl-D-alanine ligase [Bacillota bacterium]|nr:UDP-N-acetylmuramoyl-tripeptide--D-alanyl-D-alanine ligase [Bacillota bacterium]HOK63782.1 UDP-N-acetylmuramoyl-tripeptide--D-alanyl-D-alanine ligase [Bacillota bacterium]HOL11530.1 UDP-N-acetylmuramoyl-tripeptide--D-alanyl-D-alanine ligase [Bacillota bacterium]
MTLLYTLCQIAQIVDGDLLQGNPLVQAHSVAIDSRTDVTGSLFCAIVGERADGHDFVDVAEAKGAVGALVQKPVTVSDPEFGVILVESTTDALGLLASDYLSRTGVDVIGITGSVGKTSTKDLVSAVLNQRFKTYKNPGNLNSHIGLPLAVLQMEPGYRYAVLEMAMRAEGEIRYLSRIAKPKMGVLTDISESHIGVVGSLKKIGLSKAELLESLPEDGIAFLCWDSEYVRKFSSFARCPIVTYGFHEEADCRAYDIKKVDETGYEFKVDYFGSKNQFTLYMPGVHQVQNSLAAISVGFQLGLSADEIQAGLSNVSLSPMRQEVTKTRNLTIINDAYNASVKSMKAALDLLSEIGDGRKVAILGDMLEMGEYAPQAHFEVGRYAKTKADVLIAIGSLSVHTKRGWDQTEYPEGERLSFWFEDKEKAIDCLPRLLQSMDVCLVKASRGMEFESVVMFLRKLGDCGDWG